MISLYTNISSCFAWPLTTWIIIWIFRNDFRTHTMLEMSRDVIVYICPCLYSYREVLWPPDSSTSWSELPDLWDWSWTSWVRWPSFPQSCWSESTCRERPSNSCLSTGASAYCKSGSYSTKLHQKRARHRIVHHAWEL